MLKKLSKELSTTERRIHVLYPNLTSVFWTRYIKTGSAPETSRNASGPNQRTKYDDSQNDPHPESSVLQCQTMRNSDTDEGYEMQTGVQDKIAYCSPRTSQSKQKKPTLRKSTENPLWKRPCNEWSRTVFWPLSSWQTTAILPFLLATFTEFPRLEKQLTTRRLTLDGKSEKFELFEDVFQRSLKTQNQLTADDRVNSFHSLMKQCTLQTFESIRNPTRMWEKSGHFSEGNVEP